MYQFKLDISVQGSVKQVFDAWHLPEQLQKWFSPGDMVVGQVMSNFTDGGSYAIKMQESSGDAHWLKGEYSAIELNKKLAFSWHWQDEDHTTFVSVEFTPRNQSTCDIKLIHKGFKDEDDCQIHQDAWIGCLEKLSMIALS